MDRFLVLKASTRVVEAGSFTRAADSPNTPNATLSRTIKQLEAHLGVPLLQRTIRCTIVTPEGREYYERARCLLEDLEEIDASFSIAHNKPRGRLRIAIGGPTACDVLIPLLADFTTSWPDIRIDSQVADKPADLASGNIDCTICGGPMDDSTLIARKIGRATLAIYATSDCLQRCGTPAPSDELHHGHQLIGYLLPASGRVFPFHFTRHGVSTELKIKSHLGINESNARIAAGETGLDIAQIFTYSLKPVLASGELAEILVAWCPAPYLFHVVYTRHRYVPSRLRVFVEWPAAIFLAAVRR